MRRQPAVQNKQQALQRVFDQENIEKKPIG